MPIAYYLSCKTGRKYQDESGKDRESTMQVGRVVTTSGGGMMCILDGLPFAALSSKEPIALFMNAPRDREEDTPARKGPSHAPPPDSKKDDPQDDIPF